MPTVGSLFSGIGGFDLGLERAGFTVAWQVEIDPFCQRILAHHWPAVPRHGDVRSLQLAGPIDLLVGGFPCQDLSVAGKRAGLAGGRSSLFWEFIRIAQEFRPPWGLVENVPGLLASHRGADFALVLQGLRQCWPAVGYRILDSRYFGVAQRRRRLFLVGGPSIDRVAQVLFECEGGGGDPAPGGATGAHAAAHAARGADDAGGTVIVQQAISAKWSKQTSGPAGDEHHNLVVAHALSCEGADASEDGTGRGTPLIAFDPTGGSIGTGWSESAAPPLKIGTAKPSLPWAPAVVVARPLTAPARPHYDGDSETFIAFDTTQITHPENRSQPRAGDPCHTISADQKPPTIAGATAVRRLTPVECERLQGFPDMWTAVDGEATPDSPRYRALGNAVTVPVIEWLGHRLRRAL